MFFVQMDIMKCYYCQQNGASVVPWDSLLPAGQSFLRDKHPDAGEGAGCDLCVHSACPYAFFVRPVMQPTATSSAAHPVDSGLQRSSARAAGSSSAF